MDSLDEQIARAVIRYHISIDQARELLSRELCDACQVRTPDLVIDHDHTTGLVRGRLCKRCNANLGLAKDNVRTLRDWGNYYLRLADWLTAQRPDPNFCQGCGQALEPNSFLAVCDKCDETDYSALAEVLIELENRFPLESRS